MKKITFSFDVGYASIGWSVMEYTDFSKPQVSGAGVVLFEADSCLASKRREYRRMRRTIRARRKRIERIGTILEHYGIITHEDRISGGHPASFFLAARALRGKHVLHGREIWHVLRWYAHNRGYDSNSQWRKDETIDEDGERIENAKSTMEKYGTKTMAETISAILNLNTDEADAEFKEDSPKYKNLNMAFPRKVVEDEVRYILMKHSELPIEVISLILDDVAEHSMLLSECGVRLPKRYSGSILFGQLLPRFDNRIIARCPITWSETYKSALLSGECMARAKKIADKYAKVPKADTTEFYEYRFARILANIRVEGKPLGANERGALFSLAKLKGRFTKTEFIKAVRELTKGAEDNLKNYFHLVPEADKALIISPQNEKQRAAGRAPYARPVLRRVVEEILRGEDPTKAAFSLNYPNGEKKMNNGILYCLSDPESEIYKTLTQRTVDELSNNHLVRHRMLILSRLLDDMINHFAGGDVNRVTHCCLEVNRDLREYSGLSAKEIEKKQNEKLAHFKAAKAYLAKNAPDLPVSAGLIRKCRIAIDMNWTCPYTGMKYSALDLPKMDREHIVPFGCRNTNAMSALVLTYPEVNAMKGKRCALEFIRKFQGQAVPGKDNLSIMTEARFRKWVEKLDVKGSPDDCRRKKLRKKLLLLESTAEKLGDEQLGFTEGKLTQSSQLMKIGAHVINKRIPKVRIVSIPGQVTAEVRKVWKLMGTLAKSIPDIIDEQGNIVEKDRIRNITHMHHAVDACALGLLLHLIPCGDNGRVWRYLCSRKVPETEISSISEELNASVIKLNRSKSLYIDDLPKEIKSNMIEVLSQNRIIKHIPADMSGAKLSTQYKGIVYKDGKPYMENGRVILKSKGEKRETYAISKVMGLQSKKLQAIKAALLIDSNYGVALDPELTIIRHVSVYKQMAKLKKRNNGHPVRILKVGNFIRLTNHKDVKRNRMWRITSIKDNKSGIALDLQWPESAVSSSVTNQANWINVSLKSLLKSGIVILKNSYIGVE